MPHKKTVFALVGSASKDSSNLHLVRHLAALAADRFHFTVYDDLQQLPHFDPQLSIENTPQMIVDLRTAVAQSDGVLICTPEYIFSLPSGLKNVFEWCVATTVFSGKRCGLITASAHGAKGHEELQRVVKTIEGKFTPQTTLLIQGIKGKMNADGTLKDEKTKAEVAAFLAAFTELMNEEEASER